MTLALTACLWLVPGTSRTAATSVVPVTFDELVAKADVIFVGDVLDVRPFTVATPQGDIIKTRVTFVVRDALWGTSRTLESFEFLGGEMDGRGMRVAEMPEFSPGDRRVVFARRETSINPIVGFSQGLLRVVRDSGSDAVLTSDGQPLATTQDIGRAGAGRARLARPMSLSTLRGQIVQRLQERRR